MKTVITPHHKLLELNLKELFNYKDLFYILAWRDIKVRYKQTAIGVLWAFFVPCITMVVFTIFFGHFAKISSDGAPYALFVFIGLLFWTFFSQAVTAASASLINSQEMIKKIYFPRLLLPASSILVALIDFCIAALILIGMMIYYNAAPHAIALLLIPLLAVITYIAALGLGLLLAAINVKYRDVRYALPFFIQILLFVTPVIYPITIASGTSRMILSLNPMTGVIETARQALLGQPITWNLILLAFGISVILFFIGLFYFKKTERYFADII